MLYLIVALIAVFAVVSDQVTKFLVVKFLSPEGTSIDVIPGVYRFTYVRNGNGMMGLFNENRWVFVVLSLLVVAAIVVYFWKARPRNRLLCVSLGMILGGGLGNMIDRIFHADGRVVDFIDFCAFPKVWKYIYNVADIFVTIGTALLMIFLIVDTVREYKKEKVKQAAGEVSAAPASAASDGRGESTDSAEQSGAGSPDEDKTGNGGTDSADNATNADNATCADNAHDTNAADVPGNADANASDSADNATGAGKPDHT